MHHPAQTVGAENEQGSGQQCVDGEPHIDVNHEPDRHDTENDPVNQCHQCHSKRHPHGGHVIGGVGHYIPGGDFIKKNQWNGLEMGKKLMPQVPLNAMGGAKNEIAPYEAKDSNAKSNPRDFNRIHHEAGIIDTGLGETINHPLDDSGNEKLQHIDYEQSAEAPD